MDCFGQERKGVMPSTIGFPVIQLLPSPKYRRRELASYHRSFALPESSMSMSLRLSGHTLGRNNTVGNPFLSSPWQEQEQPLRDIHFSIGGNLGHRGSVRRRPRLRLDRRLFVTLPLAASGPWSALEHVVFHQNRDSQGGEILIQTPCWDGGQDG